MVHIENILSSANFDALEGVLTAIKDDRLASLDLTLFQRYVSPSVASHPKPHRISLTMAYV